ncbi:hypothetical protein [Nonomuraea candida]|uniref:hypothetical protein n=1 Tax=Nonomuraea candida TaxID=359159 RepID=UPI0005B87C76|nr:hypothetical protein [Nonomuraea candida]
MGRHGTGGSDDGDERGNSAFWGPDEQAEPPGWPSLPDQPEVTGQWAPMPRRTDPPPPRGPEPEPFETTGAFALPNDLAGPPANDPAGAFPPPRGPREDEAGPFEVTGAFAVPPEWNPNRQGDGPQNGPATGPAGGPPSDPFRSPDQTAVFGGPAQGRPGPGPGQGQPSPGQGQPGQGQPGPFDRPGPFDGPAERTAFFDGPLDGPLDGSLDGSGPFDGPAERTAFFDGPGDRPGPFDGPDDRRDPFGDPERTARFDAPPGPGSGPFHGGPPEPGDVKVAGEPTTGPAPAWASAETGFLGSGWTDDSAAAPEEPQGRRGRRRSGRGGGGGGDDALAAPSGPGKGRVALLSVAAVAVVLGGTVMGVKLMSSGDPAKCEGTTCAAVQSSSGRPAPSISEPAEEETEPVSEEEPVEEADEEESEPSKTPTPTVTSNVRTPPRATSATPTPTKSKVRKSTRPEAEPPADRPARESAPETPDATTTLDETDPNVAPNDGTTPAPVVTTTPESVGISGGSVNVKQTIRQRVASYSAKLQLSNTSAQTLAAPTISVPVDGKVVKVDGAEWTQDGDLLIMDVPETLAAGDTVEVTFTATGRGSEAQNCGLVEGECVVT